MSEPLPEPLPEWDDDRFPADLPEVPYGEEPEPEEEE